MKRISERIDTEYQEDGVTLSRRRVIARCTLSEDERYIETKMFFLVPIRQLYPIENNMHRSVSSVAIAGDIIEFAFTDTLSPSPQISTDEPKPDIVRIAE